MTSSGEERSDALPALPSRRLEEQPFGTAYVYPYDSQHVRPDSEIAVSQNAITGNYLSLAHFCVE
jgi:hypothetical protein